MYVVARDFSGDFPRHRLSSYKLFFLLIKSILSYFLQHQSSGSESPDQICSAVLETTWNKQRDKVLNIAF